MKIEPPKSSVWQPANDVHQHHGGKDAYSFPFMPASDSSRMWHRDVLQSNIATLSSDCKGDPHVGVKHECNREEEKQGQKDDIVNKLFLHEVG